MLYSHPPTDTYHTDVYQRFLGNDYEGFLSRAAPLVRGVLVKAFKYVTIKYRN